MLTMLLMRPGTALLRLYCSASRMRSRLSKVETGGYSVTTTPPGKIDCGAYGASFVSAGFGTPSGAGTGGSMAREVSWATAEKTARPIPSML